MSPPAAQPVEVVGLAPWLPWPMSASPWWTTPVRAERLAMLRVGVALCLLADIGFNYAPLQSSFFGMDGLGAPAVFAWRFDADRLTWSLLRGVGDGPIVFLTFFIWVATTCWILGLGVTGLLFRKPPRDRAGIAPIVWAFALLIYVAGLWSRPVDGADMDLLAIGIALTGLALAFLFLVVALLGRACDETQRILWWPHLFALLMAGIVTAGSFLLPPADQIDKTAWWPRVLRPWQQDETLLVAAMCLWAASAGLLLIGCLTRFAAVLTWLLSMSFANANPYLDNAGDTVRLILLFYLMLCPCGAVWSLDAAVAKRPGPVFVDPWPIRLIFVQMIFIYFMNGIYKLLGPNWRDGTALHYVLGELSLTRFSQTALPLPIEVGRVLTWSVVAWEVSFPVLVLFKWPRRIALICGVMFHLGIFATMELAGFVPYALCMYLPLVPWECLVSSRENSPE